jgi:methylase of polypeptide subunit release factors
VVLEIGHRQGHAVRALLEAARLTDVEVRPDLAGRERIAVARRPG